MLIRVDAAPKVVPEVLYKAMIDSLRQQLYPRTRQAGQDRKISDSHRKGFSCSMCEKTISLYMEIFLSWPVHSMLTICMQTGTCDTRSGDLVFFPAAFDEFSLFMKN